jgi:hypothetical protein
VAQREQLPGDVEVTVERTQLCDRVRPFSYGLQLYVVHQSIEVTHPLYSFTTPSDVE